MSDKPAYPSLSDASLVPFRALEIQLGQFPDLLDRPECPYPPSVKVLLRRLVAGETTPAGPKVYGDDDLMQEITDLYEELRNVSQSVSATDTKDRIALLKTSGDLLTKMVGLKERMHNVREMSRFQRTVLEFLEAVLTPAQRNEFLEKFGEATNVQ